ncbi:MAG TPA: class I SAM-dependent methyltransferase [Solirubrobacterales bacterium]|nr:class I SAM-dependent methyltransferase [Solirubrobacterales bacterium]
MSRPGPMQERHAEVAYDAMAPIYDDFTANNDFDGWLSDLLPHLERCGLAGNRLLDVGCGTGRSFIPMLDRGWEVIGCDLSAVMLRLAREKVGEAVRLEVADMRELPRFGAFDLVWALDDAINYLLSTDELTAALAGMRDNLAPGGLLVFDLNAHHIYRTAFAERHVVEEGGLRMVWTGRSSPDVEPGSICEAHLAIEGDTSGSARAHLHRQRHFPEAEVLAALRSVGLEILEIFGHDYDGVPTQPLDEAIHTKAIYIASHKTG